ncbi:MAG: hypothetical protein RLZZ216_546 [Cyanobacteriota bacterium]|jgi:rSAM/selenodomain-associated transferase 1
MKAAAGQSPLPVLVMMTRWPAAGRCKRRLAVSLGSERAALVQRGLTRHTLAVVEGLRASGHLHLRIALSGCGPGAARRWLGHRPGEFSLQGQGGLGERMRRQVIKASQRHPGAPVLLIGTDLPELTGQDLRAAIAALRQHPLVLGPAADGGYWLMGLQSCLLRPTVTWPFTGISWGSDQVLSHTLQRAEAQGLRPHCLQCHNDLDRLQDLRPWLAGPLA